MGGCMTQPTDCDMLNMYDLTLLLKIDPSSFALVTILQTVLISSPLVCCVCKSTIHYIVYIQELL